MTITDLAALTKKADAAVEACVAALQAFVERDTPASRRALAEARLRFRQAVEAEMAQARAEQGRGS